MRYIRIIPRLGLLSIALGLVSCSLSDMVGVSNEGRGDDNKLNKAYIESRAGGVSLFFGAHRWLANAASQASREVALFTDELTVRPRGSADEPSGAWVATDARLSSAEEETRTRSSDWFEQIYSARTQAMQARDIISRYSDDSLVKYQGLAYLVEGYSVLMLAENFCNGMPLSIARYGAPIEYTRGFSTTELFIVAGKLFDSAEQNLTGFSAYLPAAQLGRMRSLMGRGALDSAYNISLTVDPAYKYNITYQETGPEQLPDDVPTFWTDTVTVLYGGNTISSFSGVEIINGEGGVGREWFKRAPAYIDPRVPIDHFVSDGYIVIPAVVRPLKLRGGESSFPLANGVEALLVRAEYLLYKNNPSWIDPLNEARRQIGMSDITAPSLKDDALRLLFNERSAWLYLEGRRLGDLRRLVRQYSKNPYSLFPNGIYTRSGGYLGAYGTAFAFDPPAREYEINYKYDGCTNLNP